MIERPELVGHAVSGPAGMQGGLGQAGRPGEQAAALTLGGTEDPSLQELGHDSEHEVALHRAAARGQHGDTRTLRAHRGGVEQARLADPGDAANHHEWRLAAVHRGDGVVELHEFSLALQQQWSLGEHADSVRWPPVGPGLTR